MTPLCSGYVNCQANCCASHLDHHGRPFAALSFSASTTALSTAITVTSAVGNRRPEDLEAGVAVDRRPVGVVVGPDAELHARVDRDRGDDREDEDADPDGDPEDEVDALPLLGGLLWEPVDEVRDRRRHRRNDQGDGDQRDDSSPARPVEPTERPPGVPRAAQAPRPAPPPAGAPQPGGPKKGGRNREGGAAWPRGRRRRSWPGGQRRGGGLDLDAVGVILMVVGALGAALSMIFWPSWGGPGYWGSRRGSHVDGPPPAYSTFGLPLESAGIEPPLELLEDVERGQPHVGQRREEDRQQR